VDFPLGAQWAVYQRELPYLLADGQEGKWGLVGADRVEGIFHTDEEAAEAGYARFGLDIPFLIHEVRAVEPVYRVSRDVLPPSHP
jgi:hypothetical protein